MLLRFGLANHLSVLDYAELSLMAVRAIKDIGPDLLEDSAVRDPVLPVVLIYGANASGKSTIHAGLGRMRDHILNSFTDLKPGDEIPRESFRLSPRGEIEPTRFDCDFVSKGTRYHYGFEFSNREFSKEWLYSFPEGARRALYVRSEGSITFGKSLRGKNHAIKEFMRTNSLFLSVAAQNSHPMLSEIYQFFREEITMVGCGVNVGAIEQGAIGEIDSKVVDFLRLADTGIVDVTVEKVPYDAERKEMFEKISTALSSLVEGAGAKLEAPTEQTSIKFLHRAEGGTSVALPFNAESRGTIRLVALARRALKALEHGRALIVDELDVSLHTLLALELVSLFSSEKTNPKGAQLIATTHDTNILCHKELRRDQIWFCEKDQVGATSLYPLTDIRTRNTDNLEKGYLQGRFGAVPFVGRLDELFEKGV